MEIINHLSKITSIDQKYIIIVLKTLFNFILFDLIRLILVFFLKKIKDNKKEYFYIRRLNRIVNFSKILTILFIWSGYLTKFVTLISFVSAACTIALRDLVVDLFSGLYIKVKKPFSVEDRIEIFNTKGDVVNINALSFEVLEVNNESFTGQSTGVIIHVPNSYIFKYPLRNYNLGFKYIWNELIVKVPLDYDIDKAKEKLLDIVNKNDIIKSVPKKLQNQIQEIGNKYRIYYNNCEPIIYTSCNGKCVEYTVRYLVNPKKARYVSSTIWKYIIKAHQNNEIVLFQE